MSDKAIDKQITKLKQRQLEIDKEIKQEHKKSDEYKAL
jgi:hypothetical protein